MYTCNLSIHHIIYTHLHIHTYIGYYKDTYLDELLKKETKDSKLAKALAKQGQVNLEHEASYFEQIFNSKEGIYRLKSGMYMYVYVCMYVLSVYTIIY